MKKTIGILGGMGPEATAYFFDLIIKHTAAGKDQDHIPVLIWNNPKVPPRTDAILHGGQSPLPQLREGAKILCRAGADFIVMPCMTAHYYFQEITAREKTPFVHLIQEALLYAQKKIPGIKKAGLIASSGTVASGLFHKIFEKKGIQILNPSPKDQERVMEAIFGKKGIKAGFTSGRPKKLLLSAARKLISGGAEAIIAGCTEVPLALKEGDLTIPFIEPMRIAAMTCIKMAGYTTK
ncbi:MAG: amino acid racemase [Candidatus Aminicenantales bacterium]